MAYLIRLSEIAFVRFEMDSLYCHAGLSKPRFDKSFIDQEKERIIDISR